MVTFIEYRSVLILFITTKIDLKSYSSIVQLNTQNKTNVTIGYTGV